MRSWVRGKRAWFGGRERGNTYFEVPTQALLGEMSCSNDISPKRRKTELEPLGAFPFSGDGEWHTDGPVVVSKYTQTRQRLLRAKIVKSGHGRHYKGGPCCVQRARHKHYGIRNLKTRK